MELPLEGVRVVDFTVVIAGPYSTMVLGDLGAEVIRVESLNYWPVAVTRGVRARPSKALIMTLVPYTGGYPDREPGPRPWNRFPHSQAMNRNKLGMTVDFTRPEGVAVFKRLVKVSDAIVENNSSEVMNKLGIGYEVLREVKPDIIMLRMQAYGLSGPYANYRAYGTDVEAMAGHSMLRGYADTDPSLLSAMYPADAAAAMHATFAVLAALHYRSRTGKGQLVEVAMAESIFTFLGQAILDYTLNGRLQKTKGNRHHSAIQGCYRCLGEDNWVCITIATDAEWGGFCRALGHPPWTGEERFADVVGRYRHHDELDKLIEEWTTRHDHFQVMYLLQKEGVAAGPVENQKQAYHDPHLEARGYFEKVTHAETGTHLYPGMNWKMSHAKLRVRLPPVRLGEHNEYVYKHILGIADEEYARLEKEGHIGMDYAPHIL